MLHVSNLVRTQVGRSSIPVEFDKSQAKSELLFDEYYAEEFTFDGNGEIGKVNRPVIYADCESIVNRICKERRYTGVPNVIISVDGGGSFFKVCATVLP